MPLSQKPRPLLGTGLCGGLSTFSTMQVEVLSRNAYLAATHRERSATGCGEACPIFPGKRYEDWELEDPAGKGIDTVRRVRDNIRSRGETLVGELIPTGQP